MRLKTGLYQQYSADQREKEDQHKLQEKYNIEDESIKIVEKSNMFKYFVRLVGLLITWAARITLFVLAGVGLIAIIYPSSRFELFLILQDIIQQIKIALNIY